MHIKILSTTALSFIIFFVLIQYVSCKKDISEKRSNLKARLNRRKVVKRQDYYPVSNVQGYQTYSPAAAYPAGSVYTQPLQPAPAPAPAPAAPKPANPLELGGLLSNLKLPALPTIASPAASGSNPYAGYPYYYGAAPKEDDDDDEDEEDDDKNNEDDDDEE